MIKLVAQHLPERIMSMYVKKLLQNPWESLDTNCNSYISEISDSEISLTICPYPCIRIQVHGGVCSSMDLFVVIHMC